MDVDLPTADLLTNLTSSSHFELPTAVLYGWLQSLMPNGILPYGTLVELKLVGYWLWGMGYGVLRDPTPAP